MCHVLPLMSYAVLVLFGFGLGGKANPVDLTAVENEDVPAVDLDVGSEVGVGTTVIGDWSDDRIVCGRGGSGRLKVNEGATFGLMVSCATLVTPVLPLTRLESTLTAVGFEGLGGGGRTKGGLVAEEDGDVNGKVAD
jgi:hypothetical protein